MSRRPAVEGLLPGPGSGVFDEVARDRWLNVEVRHLVALAAIAREGSFREAAAALGYVQSAVSQQIAQLERLVGARLVERSRGSTPVALTDAGRLLLEHVEEILARYERAHDELASLADGLSGRLRVGMLPRVATGVLPRVLPRYGKRCPDVEVLPSEGSSDSQLLAGLLDGELDFAICELPLGDGPLDCEELLHDRPLLMVAARSPLGRRGRPVTSGDLDDLALIAHDHWRGEQTLLAWLGAQGSTPRVVFRSDHDATVQSLVAADLGAALAPRLAVDAMRSDTVLLPIEEAPTQTIGIAWHRERELSAAAEAFRLLVRGVCDELDDEVGAAL